MTIPEGKRVEIELGGKTLILETGVLAKQANTAVLATYGETVVLMTLVVGEARPEAKSIEEFDEFLPLTVEYRERMYAAGRIPGGFIKREGRPTVDEILTCRLVDRPIRALFPEGFYNEVMIFGNCLSADGENQPDVLAMNAAAACLTISDVPFNGPVGSIRVGLVDGRFVTNPTLSELGRSELDMVVSANPEGIVMVEAGAKEVPEEKILDAFAYALVEINKIIDGMRRLAELCGTTKGEYTLYRAKPETIELVKNKYAADIEKAFFIQNKKQRNQMLDEIQQRIVKENALDEQGNPREGAPSVADLLRAFAKVEEWVARESALAGKRSDGRGPKDIRPIWIKTGVLPRTHGSAIFTRGETQALVVCTLGTKEDEQLVDTIVEYSKRFMLHYNFPSFSTGEIKRPTGPGRREIGHGALAERALEVVIPPEDVFPYTIRVVSEILESNGSTSMATVCGGTLALMDAGVKIKAPVAGIAMGLVKEGDRFVVLSDILGSEDALGDMDFKVAGTAQGVTALQMDLKTPGISMDICRTALGQAREGRLHILSRMLEALPEPRPNLSPYAPKILRMYVGTEKFGLIIGGGGKTIRQIEQLTGAEIEFDDETGHVVIIHQDEQALLKAKSYIQTIAEGLKVGAIYRARVKELRDFGAMCDVIPTGEPGLVHVSEIVDGYVKSVGDYLKVGQEVDVKVVNVDEMGKVRFSIKQAHKELGKPPLEPQAGAAPAVPREGREGGGGFRGAGFRDGGRGGGRDRGGRGGFGRRDRDRRGRR